MDAIARVLDSFIFRLNEGIAKAFSVIVVLLACFVSLIVFSRWIGFNVPWLFAMSIISLIAFAFLAAAYTLGEGKHITVNVITSRLSEKPRIILEIIGYIICMAFAIVLCWEGARWLYDSAFVTETTTSGTTMLCIIDIPMWIVISLIPLGAFLLILQSLRLIVKRAYFLKNMHIDLKSSLITVSLAIIPFVLCILIAIYVNPVAGLFLAMVTLFLIGTPVAFAMGIVGCIGIYLFAGGSSAMMQAPMTALSMMESYTLAALPLFVIIGFLIGKAGMAESLFSFTELWFGRVRGSLLMVTIITGMILCATTGSSIAATSILCILCIPVLLRRGFDDSLSAGTVGGASVGSLIPPSGTLIIYGAVLEMSAGKLFMAALFPGIVIFLMYALYILVLSFTNKEKFGKTKTEGSWGERFAALRSALPMLFLPVLILGGIYAGLFTATEAAGIAVIYGLAIIVLIPSKRLSLRKIGGACLQSIPITSMTLTLLIGAMVFAIVVSQLQVANALVSFVETIGVSALVVISVLFLVLLVGGMFMSVISLMLITLPVFYPLIVAVGIDPLWLGVFYCICIEIGALTPPVGLNLFIISGIGKIPFNRVAVGLLPYIGMLAVGVWLTYLFPELCTWLPSTMH